MMMQKQEFNKLFGLQNLDAKWADFNQVKEAENKVEIRRQLKEKAVVIPKPTQEQIKGLILKLRIDGYKETKIKRIVKNTFNITVV